MPTASKRPMRRTVVYLWISSLLYGSFLLISTSGLEFLDKKFAYSPGTAIRVLTELDPSGRLAYQSFNLADFGYIVVYSATLLTWFRFLRNRAAIPRGFRPFLALVPGFLDIVETAAIAWLLREPSLQLGPLVWLTVFATPVKWTAAGLLGVVLLAGEVRWRRYLRARRRAAKAVWQAKKR